MTVMRSDDFFSELRSRNKVLIFGHRGMSQHYPENTMLSFSQCASIPDIDAIELDVHVCRSGEVVIAHDFTLKRTAGIDIEIEDLSFDELKSIDVGSFKDRRFSDARIPLLPELFSSFGSRFVYDIELKVKAGKINRELCRKVSDLIGEYGLGDRVLVSSFNPVALRAFRRISRARGLDLPMADIFDRSANVPKPLRNGGGHLISGSTFLKPSVEQLDEVFLSFHASLPVMTWTVNTAAEAQRVLALNSSKMRVFGLIGNDPELLADTVNHWGH